MTKRMRIQKIKEIALEGKNKRKRSQTKINKGKQSK